MSQCRLRPALRHANHLGAFGPGIAVAVQGNAFNLEPLVEFPKCAGAAPVVHLADPRKQRSRLWQLAQNGFQSLADDQPGGRQPATIELGAVISQHPALPIQIVRGQHGGIGLAGAGEPKQLEIQLPFGVRDLRNQGGVFLFRDGAADFLLNFRPAFSGQDGTGNPTHAERVVVERLQKQNRGIGAEADGVEKIIGRGFNEPLLTEVEHRLGFDFPLMPAAGGGLAAITKQLHHIRPSATDQLRVLGGKVSAGHDQIHHRLADGIVLGLDDPAGFSLVAGLEAFLLAGGAILAVKNAAAAV